MRRFLLTCSFALASGLATAAIAQDSTQLQPPAQQVLGGHEMTLQEAISRAMERSLSVAQATSARDAQKENRRGTIAQIGPRGDVAYTEARYTKEVVGDFGGATFPIRGKESKSGSLIITQPITGLYGYIENARASDVQYEATEEGLRLARSDAGFAGAQAFLNAYATEQQVAIAEASVAANQSSFNDAAVMNKVGRINQADYLKFQLALTQSQARLAQAKANRVVALANLRQILQIGVDETFYLKKDLPEPNVIDRDVKEAIDLALKNRSDLKQAQLNAEYVSFTKKLAATEFIPKVDLYAEIDHNFGEITPLTGNDRDTKYYGIKASWTFWNNGSSVFKIREAIDNTRRAESAYAAAKDGVRVDVITAVENLKAARESLKQAEAGIKQAEEAYRIDQLRFKSGSLSTSDRILSEFTKADTQGQFVTARTQLLSWYFQLQKALGQDAPTL